VADKAIATRMRLSQKLHKKFNELRLIMLILRFALL